MSCYYFRPHTHPARLGNSLPRTGEDQFIFTCSNGDISFCSTEYLKRIVKRIEEQPHKTFLLQSKNPKTFTRVVFPQNVILGITLETNRDEYVFSKAPKYSQRYKDFKQIQHPHKMVTIEPIIDFDLDEFVQWIKDINPELVWMGYDSGKNNLPEPSLDKFNELHKRLNQLGCKVLLKRVNEKH
jgi:protein gp37